MSKYDLIVIGGGPAGYVGAIRAAQLGKRVACVEKERAGGTCLNWGCIPTKSLLRNAELYQLMRNHAEDFGMSFDNLQYDWKKVISRSRNVSDKLAGGIEFLFKKNKVDYVLGTGKILEKGKDLVLFGVTHWEYATLFLSEKEIIPKLFELFISKLLNLYSSNSSFKAYLLGV